MTEKGKAQAMGRMASGPTEADARKDVEQAVRGCVQSIRTPVLQGLAELFGDDISTDRPWVDGFHLLVLGIQAKACCLYIDAEDEREVCFQQVEPPEGLENVYMSTVVGLAANNAMVRALGQENERTRRGTASFGSDQASHMDLLKENKAISLHGQIGCYLGFVWEREKNMLVDQFLDDLMRGFSSVQSLSSLKQILAIREGSQEKVLEAFDDYKLNKELLVQISGMYVFVNEKVQQMCAKKSST